MRLSQASQASALPAVTTFAATPTRSIPTSPRLKRTATRPCCTVRKETLFMQAVVQVGFVTSKAGGVPALTAQCLDHLKQYLTLLFSRQFGAR